MSSATTIEYHIPSSPQISGKIKTAALWNRRVLRKEMSAEVNPSLRAVKKADPKIENPTKRNENA